jgi:hypothetical protein
MLEDGLSRLTGVSSARLLTATEAQISWRPKKAQNRAHTVPYSKRTTQTKSERAKLQYGAKSIRTGSVLTGQSLLLKISV